MAAAILYQIPEIVTLGRFPNQLGSDSTWRTIEVRHGGSDTIARRFQLILPACNTEAMNLHLVEIAQTVAPSAHAVLLVDQAG